MAAEGEIVCVTGAAGFVGSWLVMRLLERGYTVRATVRDPSKMEKVKHLLDLPKAKSNMTLWKADLSQEGSFDEVIHGCKGVFHVASPTSFESEDPENEVIQPAINGVLSIMKSCIKAKTVKRLVLTSSASAVCMEEHNKLVYDETCWSDVEFGRSAKIYGWMYFVSKTLAEQEAWKMAKETNLDMISVIPPVVVGPFVTPSMPSSLVAALSPITSTDPVATTVVDFLSPQLGQLENHWWHMLERSSYVHVDCVCRAHIFLYEHPEAQGRYIASACVATIYDVIKMINQKFPQYNVNVPLKFKDNEKEVKQIHMSSKKLTDLGFEFKYGLEDMYKDAIEACQAKGFLPASNQGLSE